MLLYLASLLLPSGELVIKPASGAAFHETRDAFLGYQLFWISSLSVRSPSWSNAVVFWPWLANPVFWLGCYWFVKGRTGLAALAAGASAVLGLSILPVAGDFLTNCPGYWVWLASFLTLIAGHALKREAPHEGPIESAQPSGVDCVEAK